MKFGTIGVVAGSIFGTMAKEYLRGISQAAKEKNLKVLVFASLESFEIEEDYEKGELALLESVNYGVLDGIIFIPNSFTLRSFGDKVYEILQKRCTAPIVIMDDVLTYQPDVIADHEKAFAALTSHMIEAHNCTDIVLIAGPEGEVLSEQRISGFRNSLAEHGLSCAEDTIIYGDYWLNAPTSYAEKLVSGEIRKPQAVLCANDIMAITLARALAKKSWEVPQDLAIAGYDGTDYAFNSHPRITSCLPAYAEAGHEAVQTLIAKINGIKTEPKRINAGKLIIGESCGCLHCNLGENAERNHELYYDSLFDEFYDNRNMLMRVATAQSLSEFMRKLYQNMIPSVMIHKLCLRKNWLNEAISSPLQENEILMEMQPDGSYIEFPASSLLPPDYPILNENRLIFFTSLHFGMDFYGYSVAQSGEGKITFESVYRRFCHEVNVALEEIRMRNRLKTSVYKMHLASIRDPLSGSIDWGALLNFMMWLSENSQLSTERFAIMLVFVKSRDSNSNIQLKVKKSIQNSISKDLSYIRINDSTYCIFGMTENDKILTMIEDSISQEQQNENCSLGFYHEYFKSGISREEFLSNMNRLRQMFEPKTTNEELAPVHSRYVKMLKFIRKEIYEHPQAEYSKESFAESMYVSTMYFQKLYKQMFGIPFTRDLIEARIAMAKELLSETNLPVAEVAEACGYKNLPYFIRQFSHETGDTPNHFRKHKRSENTD